MAFADLPLRRIGSTAMAVPGLGFGVALPAVALQFVLAHPMVRGMCRRGFRWRCGLIDKRRV